MWDKLEVFYHVAKAGSFTMAAEVLHITQSALSRKIIDLELRLRKKLFFRKPRGVQLTEEGEVLFNCVCAMFREAETAKSLIQDCKREPQGLLKISTTVFFASVWLMDFIPDFLKSYPNLKLEIISDDKDPDWSRQEVDITLRPYLYDTPDLIQIRILKWKWRLYASREYLKKFGTPKKVSDLDQHRLIVFGQHTVKPFDAINWPLYLGRESRKPREPYISVNSTHAVYKAGIAGLGIVTISEEQNKLEGNILIPVLPEEKGPPSETYLAFPKKLENSPKINAFRAFLKEKLKNGIIKL